jgi:polysaccharide export outer membrane protein
LSAFRAMKNASMLPVQPSNRSRRLGATLWVLTALCGLSGCRLFVANANPGAAEPPPQDAANKVPIELDKIALPPYRLEPPDILLVDAVKVVPKAPFRIASLDVLQINAVGTPTLQPLSGLYAVEPSGSIDLGPAYGRVSVAGLTLDEATEAVARQLSRILRQPQVSLTLAQSAGQQQIQGERIIGMDGRVNFGTYGNVYVAGMTVDEAREAIEKHLAKYLDEPRVAVDVEAYNSKVYYVITGGAGFGESVSRYPITGNETVLDALSNINGISQLANKHKIRRRLLRSNSAGQLG